MSRNKLAGIIIVCVVAVVLGVVGTIIAVYPREQVEPEYIGWIDVSKPSFDCLEYILVKDDTTRETGCRYWECCLHCH